MHFFPLYSFILIYFILISPTDLYPLLVLTSHLFYTFLYSSLSFSYILIFLVFHFHLSYSSLLISYFSCSSSYSLYSYSSNSYSILLIHSIIISPTLCKLFYFLDWMLPFIFDANSNTLNNSSVTHHSTLFYPALPCLALPCVSVLLQLKHLKF
jgi:hypothetical protein